MRNPQFTDFERLIIRSKNEVGVSVLLILAWIAASDGSVDEKESKQLSEIADSSNHEAELEQLLRIVQRRDVEALQLACEIVTRNFKGEQARLFLEMAIGMAIADGYLMPTENFILRFLADLLRLDSQQLNMIFREVTGREIPCPSDVSSASYWSAREQSNNKSKGGANGKSNGTAAPDRKFSSAYAILGLEFGATKEEIRTAYRRLAQVHHPDRFSSLGAESVAAATATFQRIREAYDYLVKNA